MSIDYIRVIWHERFSQLSGSVIAENLTQVEYWKDLKRSKFVLSPPGRGEDCFRTWEAILFGAIPIVRNSTGMWPLFKKSPVFVINDSDDLNEITEETLLKFRVATRSRKVVMAPYWIDQMEKIKSAIL